MLIQPGLKKMEEEVLYKFVLSGASGAVAETVTFPIDLIKTRLQLAGELESQKVRGAGAIRTAAAVVKAEGFAGLYAGLSPAVARHIPYTGTRIAVYEYLRRLTNSGDAGGSPSLITKLGMGMTAGAVGQFIAVPADLIKVRMQADGRRLAAGQIRQPRYRGLLDALTQIAREEGVLGLWRGSSPAVQRAALVNLGELATYDQAKQAVLATGWVGDTAAAHAASAVCSGLVSSVLSTPADVIKTRLMNQDPARPLYRGTWDCARQTVRAEGLPALYKGFFPTWARLGPWQLCFWLSYEQLRGFLHLGSF